MHAKPIYVDVPNAPFHVNQRVRVLQIIDETGSLEYLGQIGHVAALDYACGCGQIFPTSPMISVSFGVKTEEFWPEELEIWPNVS